MSSEIEFKNISLKKLSKDIILGSKKSDFKETNYSIFLPLNRVWGHHDLDIAYYDLQSMLDEHEVHNKNLDYKNICEIILDSSLIRTDYFHYFMNSVGTIFDFYVFVGEITKGKSNISIEHLEEFDIKVPNMNLQENLSRFGSRVFSLSIELDILKQSVEMNPETVFKELTKLENVYHALGTMPPDENILRLIKEPEDKTLEFKEIISQSLDPSITKNTINNKVMKSIAAFLNTEGGNLIVGISEDNKTKKRKIHGIEKEIDRFHRNNDQFLLDFKDVIKQRIGEQFYSFINQQLIEVDQHIVLLVECKMSDKPVYVDQKDFYLRTTPATDKLEGQKQLDYINSRFYK